ncbi:MAG: hypothetical protein LBV30_05505 [Propionibacteriaceae bacterium]|nr:hypothetical protein [Propionibacteriaceae bacterium]
MLEAHRELDRDEIVQAFEDRNWADPSWKAVRPAVLSAIDRARNYGWIELSRADSLEYYRSIPSIDMQIGQ